MKRFMGILGIFLVLLLSVSLYAGMEGRLLRQPHINGDRVVFMYGGDIYTVALKGGTAVKLTSFKGYEVFPKFSPDGKWIAFSGEYAGTRQVYVIPADGGIPKQVTFYPDVGSMPPRGGWDKLVYDWTANSKKILVRSNRTPHGNRIGKYFLVDPFNEGLAEPLQIPEGGPATYSPDCNKLAYSIKSREFRTWKRYKAGFAPDVWVYDLKEDKIDRITDYAGTDNFPMWVGDEIYFNSDRKSVSDREPYTLNIYKYNLKTKEISKVTDFTDFDVMRPSRGKGGIVFENGGYLFHLDPETDEIEKINITIKSDLPLINPCYKNVSKFIESYFASPKAKRVLFAARGELFTVPAKYGAVRNISNTPGIREMSVQWSPDGKYISYLSEKTGDYELYVQEYGKASKPRQLTHNTGSWITGYRWSSDSRKIAFSDKKNRLSIVGVEDANVTTVDQGFYSSVAGYHWSPDNRWIAYHKSDENLLSALWIYSLEKGEKYRLTDEKTSESNPVFSADGKTMTFVSWRDYDWSSRDFKAKLYIVNLIKSEKSPFAPRNDDVELEGDKKEENKKDKDEKKKDVQVEINIKGFENRVVAYPVPPGSYHGLEPVEKGLLYLRGDTLYLFDMKKRKEEKVISGIRGYELTASKKKFIFRKGSDYHIAAVSPKQEAGDKLDLSDMEMKIDPKIEWKQIYTDAWRIMRDWFYDPDMHGVVWKAMHDKYLPLVDHIAHRTDLDYIIGELISELNAGHCYVNSGDVEKVDRIPVGLLGCEFTKGEKFYRISNIYQGENWTKELRSPLTESGIDVNEGDYLIGINGKIINTDENPYKYFVNEADKLVTLFVNDSPSEKGAREITLKTISSETGLRHYQWVERNRAIVEELSEGRIGYIYVPNTSFPGFREFYKGWLSQFTKEGLIIDDRYNGGGSLPHPMTLDMANPKLQYWTRRNLPLYSTPFPVHEGPKVMLINGRSSSGGDAFPDYFQELGLGPLMGQTTWGGLIGYSGSPSFVDHGGMAVPAFAYVNNEGEWDVEYYGVHPDIEVFDDPTEIQAGRQPMLEKAVSYILEQLEKNPVKKVKKPKGVDRSKK